MPEAPRRECGERGEPGAWRPGIPACAAARSAGLGRHRSGLGTCSAARAAGGRGRWTGAGSSGADPGPYPAADGTPLLRPAPETMDVEPWQPGSRASSPIAVIRTATLCGDSIQLGVVEPAAGLTGCSSSSGGEMGIAADSPGGVSSRVREDPDAYCRRHCRAARRRGLVLAVRCPPEQEPDGARRGQRLSGYPVVLPGRAGLHRTLDRIPAPGGGRWRRLTRRQRQRTLGIATADTPRERSARTR
jgi:hypothetical protein